MTIYNLVVVKKWGFLTSIWIQCWVKFESNQCSWFISQSIWVKCYETHVESSLLIYWILTLVSIGCGINWGYNMKPTPSQAPLGHPRSNLPPHLEDKPWRQASKHLSSNTKSICFTHHNILDIYRKDQNIDLNVTRLMTRSPRSFAISLQMKVKVLGICMLFWS